MHQLGLENVAACTVQLGGRDRSTIGDRLCNRLGVERVRVPRTHEFAHEYIVPAMAAHAMYLGEYPVSASLSRPCIAHAAVETAAKRKCNAILHTSTRSQNSLRRFNGAIRSLGFAGAYGSVFERSNLSRAEKSKALADAGFPEYGTRPHSIDENLWGRGIEAGDLDDPENLVDHDSVFEHPRRWDGGVRRVCIRMKGGVPVALNGRRLDLVSLLRSLHRIGARFRLGRFVGLEEIEGGAKVQELREMPAATILLDALRRLETAMLSAECIREKMAVEQIWVREAVEGRWFEPLRVAADAFVRRLSSTIDGEVSYRLDDRLIGVTSLKAARPLYLRDRDKFEARVQRHA